MSRGPVWRKHGQRQVGNGGGGGVGNRRSVVVAFVRPVRRTARGVKVNAYRITNQTNRLVTGEVGWVGRGGLEL